MVLTHLEYKGPKQPDTLTIFFDVFYAAVRETSQHLLISTSILVGAFLSLLAITSPCAFECLLFDTWQPQEKFKADLRRAAATPVCGIWSIFLFFP